MKETFTKDIFVKTIYEWNNTQSRDNNIIPLGEWNGDYDLEFTHNNLSLESFYYRNKDIIAVKHTKKGYSDGSIWNTYFIMNFKTMSITIQLDRTYIDGKLGDPSFSSPHFVSILIDKGYVCDDTNDLPILYSPTKINETNYNLLLEVINNSRNNHTFKYKLPIVYVSKNKDNKDPLDIGALSKSLRGIAHIFVEENKTLNQTLSLKTNNQYEYNGTIGVYLPDGSIKKIYNISSSSKNKDKENNNLITDVCKYVYQYANSQNLDMLDTWEGVRYSLLTDRFVDKKAKYTDEKDYIELLEKENEALKQENTELLNENAVLKMENAKKPWIYSESNNKAALTGEPVLYYGEESDYVEDEIKEIILDALNKEYENVYSQQPPQTRRAEVLKDIIDNNDYQEAVSKKAKEIKQILKGFTSLTNHKKEQLRKLGFEISQEGNHHKIYYYANSDNYVSIACTPSDSGAGENVARQIKRRLL